MTPEVLAEIFNRAKAAAAKLVTEDDGGTCNLDCAAFSIPKMRSATIKRAAELAGVHVSEFKEWGARRFALHVTEGQGARRTAMAEAAARSLQVDGLLDAFVWYKAD